MVGVGSYDRFPPEIERLPKLGGLLDPDTEQLLALRPDLVIVYDTQADLRHELQLGGLLDHKVHLGLFLDDDEHAVPELLPHQRQADELAILVAVADDGAALRRQRQHCQQHA